MFTTSPKNLQYLQYLQFPYTVIAANGTYCRYCTFSRDLENLIAGTRHYVGYEAIAKCHHPSCVPWFFISKRAFFTGNNDNFCRILRYTYKFPISKTKARNRIRMVLFEDVSRAIMVVDRQDIILDTNIKLLILFFLVQLKLLTNHKIMICHNGAFHSFWLSPRPARRDQHQYQSNISHSDIITHSVSYCNGYAVARRNNRWANNST